MPLPLFVALEACLGSLIAIAVNLATTNPADRRGLPGLLRPVGQHPWQAVSILTVAAGLLAWSRLRREQRTTASPLLGARTLHPPASLPLGDADQVREELLGRVRRTWIQGVLDRSLARVARVELGLAEQPGAVDHPWGTLLRQPGHPDRQLPPGTRLSQLAERFDQHLLVLGPAGAGKTTLLLEYARDLLDQADRDRTARIPAPFHLSGWPAEQPPLADWLVTELALRYDVSKRPARFLVEQDRLAVLLDGLDEVPSERRAGCAAAINAFRSEHGGVPMVVCARSRDYQELAVKLALGGAVEVQPLTRAQVRRWLAAAGQPLAGLRAALRDREHWLWELLDSPLLLSIAALTYQGRPARAIRADGGTTVLLGAYVDAMLSRPRAPLVPRREQVDYHDADTRRWLAWLARRMGAESVFYPDWMQPDWLPTRRQQWLVTVGLGLPAALGVGLGVWLATMPILSLFIRLIVGLGAALLAWRSAGMTRHVRIEPAHGPRWSWRPARDLLGTFLGFGLAISLLLGLSDALTAGLAAALAQFTGRLAGGLAFGLVIGLFVGLAAGFQPRPNLRPAVPLEGIRAAARTARIVGLVAALEVGLFAWLLMGRAAMSAEGVALGLTFGLLAVPAAWLIAGGATYLRHRLLRALLRRDRLIPADLVGFLDYADGRILLRRAGGGYLFVHRLLQDYFAAQAQQDARQRRD